MGWLVVSNGWLVMHSGGGVSGLVVHSRGGVGGLSVVAYRSKVVVVSVSWLVVGVMGHRILY